MIDPIKSIAKLSENGKDGVMIALIIMNIVSLALVYSLATNYIAEGNDVMRELTKATSTLITIINGRQISLNF